MSYTPAMQNADSPIRKTPPPKRLKQAPRKKKSLSSSTDNSLLPPAEAIEETDPEAATDRSEAETDPSEVGVQAAGVEVRLEVLPEEEPQLPAPAVEVVEVVRAVPIWTLLTRPLSLRLAHRAAQIQPSTTVSRVIFPDLGIYIAMNKN